MKKEIEVKALMMLVIVLVLAGTAWGQTTQTTTRPRIYRSVIEVLDRCPRENFPKKGEQFQPIHGQLINKWLKENAAGWQMQLTQIVQRSEVSGNKKSPGVKVTFAMTEMDYWAAHFFVGMSGRFPESDAPRFARMKAHETITFVGTVDDFGISFSAHGGSMQLTFVNCKLK